MPFPIGYRIGVDLDPESDHGDHRSRARAPNKGVPAQSRHIWGRLGPTVSPRAKRMKGLEVASTGDRPLHETYTRVKRVRDAIDLDPKGNTPRVALSSRCCLVFALGVKVDIPPVIVDSGAWRMVFTPKAGVRRLTLATLRPEDHRCRLVYAHGLEVTAVPVTVNPRGYITDFWCSGNLESERLDNGIYTESWSRTRHPRDTAAGGSQFSVFTLKVGVGRVTHATPRPEDHRCHLVYALGLEGHRSTGDHESKRIYHGADHPIPVLANHLCNGDLESESLNNGSQYSQGNLQYDDSPSRHRGRIGVGTWIQGRWCNGDLESEIFTLKIGVGRVTHATPRPEDHRCHLVYALGLEGHGCTGDHESKRIYHGAHHPIPVLASHWCNGDLESESLNNGSQYSQGKLQYDDSPSRYCDQRIIGVASVAWSAHFALRGYITVVLGIVGE
ncbi:hypothetical protein DFP72DRAFT_845009 [Ephemerocybe angulata]|uniref:Uncharacterized protein n=1 Tax=Ephemerocybe angulata TaxID=980116 RepID=A0A8H6I691_9AGAR|nr:hypothetical protein DFP72DRAFT_845009 [Tulosesus angulatus]